jgi:hypothetical protein
MIILNALSSVARSGRQKLVITNRWVIDKAIAKACLPCTQTEVDDDKTTTPTSQTDTIRTGTTMIDSCLIISRSYPASNTFATKWVNTNWLCSWKQIRVRMSLMPEKNESYLKRQRCPWPKSSVPGEVGLWDTLMHILNFSPILFTHDKKLSGYKELFQHH